MEDLLRQIPPPSASSESSLRSMRLRVSRIPVTDEKSLEILKEYERRDLAEFIMRRGLPPRLPDECPECWERKKKVSKGVLVDTDEFKHSKVLVFKCSDPNCGHRWVA